MTDSTPDVTQMVERLRSEQCANPDDALEAAALIESLTEELSAKDRVIAGAVMNEDLLKVRIESQARELETLRRRVPEGYVVVPRDKLDEAATCIEVANSALAGDPVRERFGKLAVDWLDFYRALIAAAPEVT